MIASIWDLASEHVLSFSLGVIVGFVASDRYRLVKRDREDA